MDQEFIMKKISLGYPFSGCGLAGIVYYQPQVDSEYESQKFKQMIRSLSHRGPDGEGLWEKENIRLGHRRLSIQDLTNAGEQPMTRDHLTIVFNGEIYNFLEIKKTLEGEGFDFTSHTDTEVILRAYQFWGENALQRFNGMFAFAIWDDQKKILFIARDRIGVKPLYYYQSNSTFIFASEVQTLLYSHHVPIEINWDALNHQVFFEGIYDFDSARTLINNIQILLPGHYIKIPLNENAKLTKYWDLPTNKIEESVSDDTLVKELQELIIDSIKLRLISDVPVAAFLSGGIDSSLINILASQLVKQGILTAITLDYQGGGFDYISKTISQDTQYSLLVAQSNKISHHIVNVDPLDITLEKIISTIDLATIPNDIRHLSIQENYSAVQESNFKVVLNGQGADELMGGYFFSTFFQHIYGLMSMPIEQLSNLEKSPPPNPRYVFLQGTVLANGKRNFVNLYKYFHSFEGDILEKTHRFHMKTLLQWILRFEDFLSMSKGIECRLPFLDYRIMEWAFRIPYKRHIQFGSDGYGKILLRSAAKNWVPLEVLNRPKQAFPYPNEQKILQKLINIFQKNKLEILSSEVINKIYKSDMIEQNFSLLNSQELWRIIALWQWEKKLHSISQNRLICPILNTAMSS